MLLLTHPRVSSGNLLAMIALTSRISSGDVRIGGAARLLSPFARALYFSIGLVIGLAGSSCPAAHRSDCSPFGLARRLCLCFTSMILVDRSTLISV